MIFDSKLIKLRKDIMNKAIENGFNARVYKNKNGDDVLMIEEGENNGTN